MDDALFHKQQRTRELIEEAGCTLLFFPPYFPDLNPIEKFWANRKFASILHLFLVLRRCTLPCLCPPTLGGIIIPLANRMRKPAILRDHVE
ncbi:MAG: transposase [Puniceicoccales bacterium]|nr:transposase [Puniceicoccales bacterium]